jgi:hypothetical protein
MAQREDCRTGIVAAAPSTYPTVWTWLWSVVATLGVGLAILAWGPGTTAVTAAVLTGLAVMMQALTQAEEPVTHADWERRMGRGLFAAAAVVAFVVLCQTAPEIAVPLLALGLATHPHLLRRLRRRQDHLLSAAPPPDELVHPHPGPSQAGSLSDDELCLAWRRSFLALQRARTNAALHDIVRLRQAYLDELARRHPTQLQAWLESGARAASGPDRYLHGGSPHSPSA